MRGTNPPDEGRLIKRQRPLFCARLHHRMKDEGLFAESIHAIFSLGCRKAGLATRGLPLSTAAFHRPHTVIQLELFSAQRSDFS